MPWLRACLTGLVLAQALLSPARAEPQDAAVPLKFVAIGGGATPESTEVSLEQNLELAQKVLPGPGALYFGGGRGSRCVRVEAAGAQPDALLVRLGDLFNPRAGRRSHYRVTDLPARAASLAVIEAGLITALDAGRDPLLLFVSTHGEQGEVPQANSIALWGGHALSVQRLAELHDAHPRPLRLVAASCFSGGFAELAFKGGDAKLGPAAAPRCGLFAGTWDRETSGCDPDPDRRKQEGYSLHVLQALRGLDREGRPLPIAELDVDRDGRISLLEAHARATIAGRSIDVPTTTSERYLRSAQRNAAALDRVVLPEYTAIIDALGARLGLRSQHAVEQRRMRLERELNDVAARLDESDAQLHDAYAALSGRLLARWPELDDAYHPNFAATLARDRAQIEEALRQWPEAAAHAAVQRAQAELEAEHEQLQLQEAQVTRLRIAYQTLALASALQRRGGARWQEYQRLLRCERFVP